ncbi:MAG: hypothetical protein ING36_11155 [Burkholderiales bacterium]|nr:hypothetical protein [Burkholderiales bacterium]
MKKALIDRRSKIAISRGLVISKTMGSKAEESLRLLMVKALPGLRKSQLTFTQISDMISWTSDVSHSVSVDDFRMIDALNVVYEAWSESWEKESREEFLRHYAYALDRVISQL